MFILVTFGIGSVTTTVNIITYIGTNVIDASSAVKYLLLQLSTAYLLNEPSTYFTTKKTAIELNSATNIAGVSGAYGFYLSFKTPVALEVGQIIRVNLPIQATKIASDFDVAFGTSFEVFYPISVYAAEVSDWTTMIDQATTSVVSVASRSITLTLPYTVNSDYFVNLIVDSK